MEVHIGKEIEKQFQKSGIKIGSFAEKISTGERNVYSLFRRKDISSEMLVAVSKALNYNFFKLYTQDLANTMAEPEAEYQKPGKAITVSVDISATMQNVQELPELIKEINEAAVRRGFKLV